MPYIVIVRYLPKDSDEWGSFSREFGSEDAAESYAKDIYESSGDRDRELVVLIYSLVKSFN